MRRRHKWRGNWEKEGDEMEIKVLGSHNNNLYTSKWSFIPCLLSQCQHRSPWGAQQCVLITILMHAYWNHTKLKFFHFNFLPEKEMSADNGFLSPTSGKRALFIYFFSFSSSSWHLLMWVYVSHFYNVIIAMQQSRLEQLAVGEREIKLWLAQSESHEMCTSVCVCVRVCVCVPTCIYRHIHGEWINGRRWTRQSLSVSSLPVSLMDLCLCV